MSDLARALFAIADAIRQQGAPRALGFEECCDRLGISLATGKRLVARGRFPIPAMPPLPEGSARRTYSTLDIEAYLREAAVSDVLTPSTRRRYGLVSSK